MLVVWVGRHLPGNGLKVWWFASFLALQPFGWSPLWGGDSLKDISDVAWDQLYAYLTAYLAAHPNLKAIFGVSAEVCPGAAAALKQQGKAGAIILAGFDDLPDTLAGIRSGVVNFCIAQRTYKMGWLSVEKLLDAIDGKALPKEIDTGVLVISKDNVDTYMQDMKKEFAK